MTRAAAMLGLGTASVLAAGCAASNDPLAADDQLLAPDATGWVDRSATGTTGIQGQWHAFADTRFGAPAGDCQTTAFGECSIVYEPAPGSPYAPTSGLGMCTSGVIARWISGSSGLTPDYSPGWAGIVLELDMPAWPEPRASLDPPAGQPHDAVAHGVTGFAFDIDSEPGPGAGILVTTVGPGESSPDSEPVYWGGGHLDTSPVHAGHNEFRWREVGPGSFDGTRVPRVGFLVAGNDSNPVSYDFCIDNLTALRSPGATDPRSAFDDQPLVPDATGWVDRSSTGKTKIQGAWFAVADGLTPAGLPGECQAAGHADAECSTFHEPGPTTRAFPPTQDLGMCTSGTVAKAVAGADGQPDYSHIWGGQIAFLFNIPSFGSEAQLYDTVRGGVTGFAFDIDVEPPANAKIAVELTKDTTSASAPATWGGQIGAKWSPVHAGHNEFRWEEVGGPWYLTHPPKFDPRFLRQIGFHVPNPAEAASYSFCINNLTALRH